MAKATFDRAFDLVIAHEGGYVNHPQDPGGATNLGVTQATLSAWLGRAATISDVKALTRAKVKPIYRKQYWDAIRGDDLPAGLDYAVFDYAVNSGSGRAARDLQRCLRVAADGSVGVMTLRAAEAAAEHDELGIIDDLCDLRLAFLRRLKTFRTFGKGWTRRVAGVRENARKIAAGDTRFGRIKRAPKEDWAKANPEDLKPEIDGGKAMQAGLIGGGVAGQALLDNVSYLQWLGDSPVVQMLIAAMVIAGVGLILWSTIRKPAEVY